MKQYVIGDIHGNYNALVQCLERSKFDIDNDKLIILGDVVDGYPDTKKCIDLLLSIKNYVMCLGNHDEWALDWMEGGFPNQIWTEQGGRATISSYCGITYERVPLEHIRFLSQASLYHKEGDKLFVHGGIKLGLDAKECSKDYLLWDRTLAELLWTKREKMSELTPYSEIYIGHTTTQMYNTDKPMHAYEVWNLDTGAGWGGKLTIMDIDTHEYWQSDSADILYPNHRGRRD